MSYYKRISRVSKRTFEPIRNWKTEDFIKNNIAIEEEDEDKYIAIYKLFPNEIDIPSIIDYSDIETKSDVFFKNDLKADFEREEIVILNKESFKMLIQKVIKLVIKSNETENNNLNKDEDNKNYFIELIKCDNEYKIREFRTLLFDLDSVLENKKELIKTDLFEYMIFNLIYIYKTLDWNNEYLVLYGW